MAVAGRRRRTRRRRAECRRHARRSAAVAALPSQPPIHPRWACSWPRSLPARLPPLGLRRPARAAVTRSESPPDGSRRSPAHRRGRRTPITRRTRDYAHGRERGNPSGDTRHIRRDPDQADESTHRAGLATTPIQSDHNLTLGYAALGARAPRTTQEDRSVARSRTRWTAAPTRVRHLDTLLTMLDQRRTRTLR